MKIRLGEEQERNAVHLAGDAAAISRAEEDGGHVGVAICPYCFCGLLADRLSTAEVNICTGCGGAFFLHLVIHKMTERVTSSLPCAASG